MISARAALPGGAWRGNAAALAQWGLGAIPIRSTAVSIDWNTDNTTTANDCLCADPALDDNNKIKEDVNAVYLQVAMQRRAGQHADQPAGRCSLRANGRDLDVEHSGSHQAGRNGLDGEQRLHHRGVPRRSSRSPKRRTTATSCRASTSTSMLTDAVKARISYSKTIARAELRRPLRGRHRPRCDRIGPDRSVDPGVCRRAEPGAGAARVGQPRPVASSGTSRDQGYVSAGFWKKRVNNFIGTPVLQESLFGIHGPDLRTGCAVRARLPAERGLSDPGHRGGRTTSTAAARRTTPRCSLRWRCCAMTRRPAGWPPTTAAPRRSSQWRTAYDLVGEDDDPLYTFDVKRPVNQKRPRCDGWELGGQYFFGDTGFGILAELHDRQWRRRLRQHRALRATTQFALLGLSDTANARADVREVRQLRRASPTTGVTSS